MSLTSIHGPWLADTAPANTWTLNTVEPMWSLSTWAYFHADYIELPSLSTWAYCHTVDGKYCTLCVQIVWVLHGANLYQSAWGTMETSFVYFQILKWAVHQGCVYQHSNDKNYFLDQIDTISKKIVILQSHVLNNVPVRPSKSLLKSPSGGRIIFLLAWHELKDTIWLADFLSTDIILADTKYWVR